LAVGLLILLLSACTFVVEPTAAGGTSAAATAMPEEEASAAMPATMSDEDKIANAMTAGPADLAAEATILDWPSAPDADFTVLREGANGWSCLPDDPSTPNADDPLCLDANWMEFFAAFMAGRDPAYTGIGLGYMLQGGGAASTTDPFLMEPPAGQDWMLDPPHIMVTSLGDLAPTDFAVDPMLHQPYIMFEGTPYEHLMVPVEMPAAQPSEDRIANALSAAPAAVAEGAAVMDFDASGLIELRPGSNGWTCVPDGPLSPGNDPMCLDAAWMEWLAAYVAGEDPAPSRVGIAYMLQGGSDASNTDPLAQEPEVGADWVDTGPHIMVLSPEPLDPAIFSTDHSAPGPYIMWAGTPYEHLMVPITEHAAH
jgi:hypothetical protein